MAGTEWLYHIILVRGRAAVGPWSSATAPPKCQPMSSQYQRQRHSQRQRQYQAEREALYTLSTSRMPVCRGRRPAYWYSSGKCWTVLPPPAAAAPPQYASWTPSQWDRAPPHPATRPLPPFTRRFVRTRVPKHFRLGTRCTARCVCCFCYLPYLRYLCYLCSFRPEPPFTSPEVRFITPSRPRTLRLPGMWKAWRKTTQAGGG